ncbi:DUF3857 and transglutaminase domain-containing protein [Tenacibaculum sp. AHE15PA]|uniref:DUF3857 domain-containing protein n=1 Tax=Tenacibaculum TaxID=104267 RepID=UPI001C4FC58B|nr:MULTISPECIES: DUF3857 domain-containing protein [Tenacibaculum]QXP73458.1 DUF3857 and transglutaminase domain-containing protein [Tenacibaculum sp. AHE14PA]QXP74972.1 DUF3857 and transglutaminase domain-containing protein [Tenacibaculum sp. AHE15PA]
MKKLLLFIAVTFSLLTTAQEIKFGEVFKEELKEKFHPLDSTADAAYLLKKRKTHFIYDKSRGFLVVTEYHERIKIYSTKGYEYATKKMTYYKPKSGDHEKINSIKAYTFNLENGKILKQKLSKKNIFDDELSKYRSQKKITLPNINKGSVLDIKYTLTSPYWGIEKINFQYEIPVKKLDYQIEIPEYFTFNSKAKGYYNVPVKQTNKPGRASWTTRTRTSSNTGRKFGSTIQSNVNNNQVNYTIHSSTFIDQNIPALKGNESHIYNIANYRGGIQYELSGTKFPQSLHKNYSTNWETVCKTIYKSPSFGGELEKNNYYNDELTNLISIAKNDLDKTFKILQFVKAKVKWNGYYGKYTDLGVKKAFKEGVGNTADINLMLTAMLRSANLNANPVLISSKNNGIPLFPTIEGLNYVISKVNFNDGKFILLDATETYSMPNTLPHRALNWLGREVFKDGSSKEVSLTPRYFSKENNILHIKINNLGEVNGMMRKTLSGHSAMYFRKKNSQKKESEVKASLEEKYSIEINDYKLLNEKKLLKPVIRSFKFTSEDFIENINGKLYFHPMFFLATTNNPFKSKERNFPVDYIMPWQDNFSVSITIPQTYSIESYPENIAIGLPDNLGIFKFQITIQQNKIKLSSIMQINSNIITPEHYNSLQRFYKDLVSKQTEKIVLIKK